MKLLRYGPPGQERPGLLGANNQIRDLSDHLADVNGQALASEQLARLSALDPATLPVVNGSPRLGCPGSPALLVEFKASGVQQRLGVPRLCRFFARPRSRTGSRRQGCPKLRLLPTGSQLSD